MKKIILSFIIVAALLSAALVPQQGEAASKLDELKKQMQQLSDKQKATERSIQRNSNEIKNIDKQKKVTEKEINFLLAEINKTVEEIRKTEEEIKQVGDVLIQTATELEDAEKRVAIRDDLLRARLRLMYTNGAVSYLEVLFSATSFADFLDRYQSLSLIVDQDKDILEDNIRDKNLIADNKLKVEQNLEKLHALYEEMEDTKKNLQLKEHSKEVMIAQLEDKRESLEEITEEQEKALIDFANKASKLAREINQMQASLQKGKFAWPLPKSFRISSNFGYRVHPITKKKKLHSGTDIAAPGGTNVLAAGGGIVIVAKTWGGYGRTVVIDHLNGKWTLYAHMRKIVVEEGDQVKTGQKVGEVGSTGTSTGNHLHFEVRIDSEPVDPMKYTLKL